MRCKRLTTGLLLTLLLACSRETPAPPPPPPAADTGGELKPPSTSLRAGAAPRPTQPGGATYADAIKWMKSAKGFRFELEENGARASGTMTRERIGEEKVELTAAGKTWRAAAGPTGVVWTPANPPDYAGRMYQRVTIAFDPQKKEGEAQLVGSEGGLNHYRFTDANTGSVHDVWVTAAGHIERMTIGDRMKLTIRDAR
jgi:hypothetical protein